MEHNKPRIGRILAIVGVIVIIAGVGVFMYWSQLSSDAYVATTFAETKASASESAVACVAVKDRTDLKVPYEDQTEIVDAASSNITDVPAGTNLNVYIDAYSSSKSAGSVVYDGNYGSYNFTATKKTDSSASFGTVSWAVDTFVACKK